MIFKFFLILFLQFFLYSFVSAKSPEQKMLDKVIWAVKADRVKEVEHFIDNEFNLNARVYLGLTLLQLAVEEGSVEVTELLIDKGADARVRTVQGNTLLHRVAVFDDNKLAELLIGRVDIHARDRYGFTPLHKAARHNSVKVAELFMKSGADLHAQTIRGRTPFQIAAMNGHVEVARFFVENGADIHIPSNIIQNPLYASEIRSVLKSLNIRLVKSRVMADSVSKGIKRAERVVYNLIASKKNADVEEIIRGQNPKKKPGKKTISKKRCSPAMVKVR